jgi:hypothetical protein
MRKLITVLVATFTILLAGSIVGKAEAEPRPTFPLTKSYTTEKVAYYHRYARRHYRRGYRRGYYGYGYGYRPYYGYGYHRPYYGYGYRRHYGWRY